MENLTDAMLVVRMKAGDQEAFAELYNRYKTLIYRTACLTSGNAADGEDIMQETFLKAYLHCGELRSDERFQYWLLRILNRTAWAMLKKIRQEFPDEHATEKAEAENNLLTEHILLQKEQYNEVFQAVMQLKYKLRIVVILYYYDGMHTKEIAKTIECREGTVKSRLFTARIRLKELLKHKNIEI